MKIKNKKVKNTKKENNLNFLEGIFSDNDYLSPSYINLNNPKYIEIDNIYYSSILIINYFREQSDLILKSIIDTNIDINISIFYEKLDTYKKQINNSVDRRSDKTTNRNTKSKGNKSKGKVK